MENVDKLLKGTVEELDRLLNARNVIGDPIKTERATVFPIVSFGFGFGAGGMTGSKSGGGTGAGGGIKPVGAIIIDEDGARVERIHGATSEMIGVISKAAVKAVDKAAEVAGRKSNDTEA